MPCNQSAKQGSPSARDGTQQPGVAGDLCDVVPVRIARIDRAQEAVQGATPQVRQLVILYAIPVKDVLAVALLLRGVFVVPDEVIPPDPWILDGEGIKERHGGDVVSLLTTRLKQHHLVRGFGEIAGERATTSAGTDDDVLHGSVRPHINSGCPRRLAAERAPYPHGQASKQAGQATCYKSSARKPAGSPFGVSAGNQLRGLRGRACLDLRGAARQEER
jgi:hypothetical protein